jgi:hypothetical protein
MLSAGAVAASAAPKAAVFPFDFVQQTSEEDFFLGPQKPTTDEERRLKLAHDEFVKMLAESGKYATIDLTPMDAEIAAFAPLYTCNGCEMDFAKKAGAEVIFLGVVEKASATLLNMNLIVVDVNKGEPIKKTSVVFHGNTDDAWLGGVRWLVRNRVLTAEEAKP